MHEGRFARAGRSGNREEFAALHLDADAAQSLHFVLADNVGLHEISNRDDGRHDQRPRPPAPPNRPGVGISGLPVPPGVVVRAEARPVTPVTTSMFCCSSPLRSSVFVPSVTPRRTFTALSWCSMNNQMRPRDSTGGNGAKSASIVCAC